MSRRRASYRPHDAVTADDLYRVHYGERARRDPADLTIVSAPEEHGWWGHVGALALAIGAAAFCMACWVAGLAWLGVR
jgi:hypothetical protein